MNKNRRQQLRNWINRIDIIKSELESILSDEEMYFDVNGLIEETNEESGTNGYVTLREIVAYYNNKGYELYDRLTGFVINDESMSTLSFKTTKNLVLQIRERKVS